MLLDPETLAVTHVSAGSVLQTAAYFTEGFMKGVLTVGSWHILDGPHGQVCERAVLRCASMQGLAAAAEDKTHHC